MTTSASPSLPATTAEQPLSRLRQWALYAAFGVASFLLFLLVTFPYDAVKQRLVGEAAAQGLYLRVHSLGPAFFGVHAQGLELSRLMPSGDSAPPQQLRIASLTLHPSLIPLGVGFSARLLGGTAKGAAGGSSALRIKLALSDIDLANPDFQAISGLQATGKLSGDADLEIPTRTEPAGAQPGGGDLGRADGHLALVAEGLSVLGGTVTVPIGDTPTPLDLPRANLGRLDAEVKIDRGTGTTQRLSLSGGELEAGGSGSIRLDRQLPLSDLNMQIKLRLDADFQKRLGLLGSGVTMLPTDPSEPGWRVAKVSGILNHLKFSPGR